MIQLLPVEPETFEVKSQKKQNPFTPFTGNTLEEKRVWILENLEKMDEQTPFLFSCIEAIKEVLNDSSFVKNLETNKKSLKVFSAWTVDDFLCHRKSFNLLQEIKGMKSFK